MSEQEKIKCLEAILENDELMNKIADAGSKENIQKILADNGLELTMEEVTAFISSVVAASSQDNEELSVGELENVAGGVAPIWIFKTAAKVLSKTVKKAWELGSKLADYI